MDGSEAKELAATEKLIALDWGTTRLRAYLLGDAGAVLDKKSDPLGILNVAQRDFEQVFEQVCGPWLERHGPLPTLASGMIGSRQGWVEAPYVSCPASLSALADKLARFDTVKQRRFGIVPGVTCDNDLGVPDVMRGEETQIFGALDESAAGTRVFVLPGTHSKWATIENQSITWFATFMTGEVFAALCEHTILGRTMEGREHDAKAFRRGCEYTLEQGKQSSGLLNQLFSARTLGLFNRIAPRGLYSYLSGLLIGSEIQGATQTLSGTKLSAVTLIGDRALCGLYARALESAGLHSEVANEEATARGLWRIACAGKLV